MTHPSPTDLANLHQLQGHEVTYRTVETFETRVERFVVEDGETIAILGKTYDSPGADSAEFECLTCGAGLDVDYTEGRDEW